MSDDRMAPPPGGRRVYLGRLPPNTEKKDVEDFFAPIGFTDCRIMGHFGFVEFGSPEDADDAVAHNARKPMLGADIIVEKAKENSRPRREPGGYDSYGGPPPPRRGPAPGRGVRLTIRGLSPDVSWQDLKDFGREGGAVIFADVNRAGEGVLEYASLGEAEQAMDRLSTQTVRGGKVDIIIDDAPPRGGPPPRDYDRGYDRGGRGDDRGGYGGRDSYRDRRSPPPRRDYGGRYDDRERDRDYRDRSPRRDRDRSPPPRSRDYDRRSPPPPSRERDLPPPRRGDDRDYR